MLLKKTERIKFISFFKAKISQTKRSALFLALIAFFLVFFGGALSYRYLVRDRFFDDVVKPAISVGLRVPVNYFQGFLSNPEKISIDIKFDDYQKILRERDNALKNGFLGYADQEEVPATLTHNGKQMHIKIRLKGDATDHLRGEKWSFRVKVDDGNNSFLGMTRFSMQAPATRQHIFEWIFHQLLKKEELVSLDYDFIDVTLNGKRLGIYAIEEFFSERVLTSNSLPVGPILKINEDLYYDFAIGEDNEGAIGIRLPKEPLGTIYAASSIEIFEPSKWTSLSKDTESYKIFQTAKDLLESFRSGRLKASEAFDVSKTAKFFAIMDLTKAFHASTWPNMRFYYNPITSRLEFVGYDASSSVGEQLSFLSGYPRTEEHLESSIDDVRYDIFKDPVIYREYIKQLERISKSSYLDDFFSGVKEILDKKLAIIYRDEPFYFFNKNWLYDNQKSIDKALRPLAPGIMAYFKGYDETSRIATIQVGNIQSFSLEILEAQNESGALFKPLAVSGALEGRSANGPVDFKEFQFAVPRDFKWSDKTTQSLILNYKILGASTAMTTKIIPWSYFSDVGEIEKIKNNQNPNVYLFNFLITNYLSKTVSVKQGIWTLTKDLIIPPDFTFVAGPDSEINITNSAKIISYSPLNFIGGEEHPVKIFSSDKTGKGILVLASGRKSYLNNVAVLNNLMTFYESPVDIANSRFIGSTLNDDTVHIVRSEFSMSDSLFQDTLSDGLDVDFGKGTLTRMTFVNTGNDAMDFSGSYVKVKDSHIDRAGDKGISAGEQTNVNVVGLTVVDSNIGLASKDLSELTGDNIEINGSKVVGITVFQKKPEFGPGKMIITNLRTKNNTKQFLVEKGSLLQIDGKNIEDKEANLSEKFYGK
ncbi:MAG: CotH kinase family protein [bacterium]|nr:CotH kinase family protein [bacterium]